MTSLSPVMSTKKKKKQQLTGEMSTIEPAFHIRLLNIGRRAGIAIPSTVTTLQMDVKILSESHGFEQYVRSRPFRAYLPTSHRKVPSHSKVKQTMAVTSTSLEEFPATNCPVQYNTTLWLSGCIGSALILQW